MAENFHKWRNRWDELAIYQGARLPDPTGRTEGVLRLWSECVPGNWQRGIDRQLLGPRYRRGDFGDPRPGEHTTEHEILVDSFDGVTCLGAQLIDGINAMPLTRDLGGGRSGNVEADLLLLLKENGAYRLAVCEVKNAANNAWYAAVENLRQLKLLLSNKEAQKVFSHRNPEMALPLPISPMALVIAPYEFYYRRGQRDNARPHAKSLLGRFRFSTGVDAWLTCWDPETRVISPL
jgi:hypothetical protein